MLGRDRSTFESVLRIVEKWHPARHYRNEAGFRDDLLKYIRKELKKETDIVWGTPERHRVRKEAGRHLADIAIDGKIGIELKRNLSSQDQLDRAVGQINRFMESYRYIIVVLCGRTSEEKFEDLQHRFREYSGAWGGPETIVKIFQKRVTQKKKGPKGWIDLFEEVE